MPLRKKTVVILAIVALPVLVSFAYLGLFLAASKDFAVRPSGALADGLTAVENGFVNAYLLEKDGRYVLVDAGADAKALSKELGRLGVDPRAVEAVLLTHTDFDHRAGAGLFPNATVYISEPEEAMLDGRAGRFFGLVGNSLGPHERLADGSTAGIAGFSVKTIVTPGHSPGSACFLVDGRWLFTGDTVGVEKGTPVHFPAFFNLDTKTNVASLSKLDGLIDGTIVCTAHFGVLFPGK